MPSLGARMLPVAMRLGRFRSRFNDPSAMQRHIDEVSRRPEAYAPPARMLRDASRVDVSLDRVDGWPVYTVAPRGQRSTRRAVYVHGGAWVNEITDWHWRLIASLVARSGATLVVPVYPLAPFGTAATVVPRVADLLAEAAAEVGPDRVTVMGDSAGGQISLSAALELRDRGVRLGDVLLISPALDLSLSNPDVPAVELTDPWLARAGTRVCIDLWRGGLDLDDPRVSPLSADLTGLGPTALWVGTRDIVWPDCRLLVDRAREADVPITLHEQPGLVHVFPLLPLAEGRQARDQIVERLR